MSDTPEAGPLSIDDAVEDIFATSEEEAPALETEAAPDAEPIEAEADEAEAEEDSESPEDGDPEADDAEEPQHLDIAEYGELTTTVKVNGQDVTVNLDELAKGYSRQADYTRKQQSLAEERKTFEAEKAEAMQQLAGIKRQLDEQLAAGEEKEPDWLKLIEEDPFEAQKQKVIWDQKQQQREAAQWRQRAEQAAYAKRTAALAADIIPEWREQGKAGETAKARRETALAAGFKAEEYEQAIDGRLAVILEWASRYRESQKNTDKAVKKVVKAPKVLKPGTTKTPAENKADRAVAKSRTLSRPHTIEERLKALGID